MSILNSRLVALATVLFVALAVTQGSNPAALVASVAAVVLVSAVAAALVVGAREVTVGARARAHRQVLSEMPEPSHPATAGRPMTRAPAEAVAA
ncbi:MAG: hypothetical protein ABI632_06860 [Pseudolysinimonas sp.]